MVAMAISSNPKSKIYRNVYENNGPSDKTTSEAPSVYQAFLLPN